MTANCCMHLLPVKKNNCWFDPSRQCFIKTFGEIPSFSTAYWKGFFTSQRQNRFHKSKQGLNFKDPFKQYSSRETLHFLESQRLQVSIKITLYRKQLQIMHSKHLCHILYIASFTFYINHISRNYKQNVLCLKTSSHSKGRLPGSQEGETLLCRLTVSEGRLWCTSSDKKE